MASYIGKQNRVYDLVASQDIARLGLKHTDEFLGNHRDTKNYKLYDYKSDDYKSDKGLDDQKNFISIKTDSRKSEKYGFDNKRNKRMSALDFDRNRVAKKDPVRTFIKDDIRTIIDPKWIRRLVHLVCNKELRNRNYFISAYNDLNINLSCCKKELFERVQKRQLNGPLNRFLYKRTMLQQTFEENIIDRYFGDLRKLEII